MFFKTKKKKLDSKVRFQQKDFTNKLRSASSYKRVAPAVPEDKTTKILQIIGLGTKFRQTIALLIVLGIIYLVYVPNFLSVKQVQIIGIDELGQNKISDLVLNGIKEESFFKAQNNILFTNTHSVTKKVENTPEVLKVKSVKKDFWQRKILIELEAKYTGYLLKTPENVFDIYIDGAIKNIAGINIDDFDKTTTPLIKIRSTSVVPNNYQGQVIDKDYNQQLVVIKNLINKQLGWNVLELVLDENLQENDISESASELKLPYNSSQIKLLIAKPNTNIAFNVIYDPASNIEHTTQQLEYLISQTPLDRLQNLVYIDLRIPDKAYLCLKNSPCAP